MIQSMTLSLDKPTLMQFVTVYYCTSIFRTCLIRRKQYVYRHESLNESFDNN